jgi:DNA processing protein
MKSTEAAGLTPEALARVGLELVPGLGPRRVEALVAHFGYAVAVVGAAPAVLVAAGLPAAVAARVAEAPALARREAARSAAAGARLLARGMAGFPARLETIDDPPAAVHVLGDVLPADEVAVAVVGARRASEYGRRVAEEIARGLALAGVTVVSGLAAGIDAAAHQAALDAGGRTIAVLGTGIDQVYPPWHRRLRGAVAARGALLTELPCGTPPLAHHFPRRNRLISGLACGVVVVEAAERSGSLITARCALEQGREVLAVPGPVGIAAHHGPHQLIRGGATLVTSAEDVLAEIAPAAGARLAAARAAAEVASLTPVERLVLEAVGPDGRHVDEVIRRAAVAAAATLETLLALELRGLVRQLPGKRFRREAA